ncbi:MAG: hypothetical protein ACOCRK_01375 [bacterium]
MSYELTLNDVHEHRKYYYIAEMDGLSSVLLPDGEYYIPSYNNSTEEDTMQVYVNGILQTNRISYTEILDENEFNKGIGVDFSPENLYSGDIVTIKWVIKN